MSKNWTIDGVPAGLILRDVAGSRYTVCFDKNQAALEDIEKINWEHPAVVRVDADENAVALPEGYGFTLVELRYTSLMQEYRAEIEVLAQYLGDVTGYREELETAQAENSMLRSENSEMEADLEQAYELLYGGEDA